MAFKYKARSPQQIEKQAEQQGSSFEGIIKDSYQSYRYRKGDNWIRILPPTWENPDDFGYEVFTHGFVGPSKATVLCPVMNPTIMPRGNCPICEAGAKADRRGDVELGKRLRPTKRYIAWVLDKHDADKGPLVCNMPWGVDRDINKICRDRDTGEYVMIDDPENGYDIHFDKEGEKDRTKYGGFQLSKRTSSVEEKYLNYVVEHPIPVTLRTRTYAEIKALFEGDDPKETETSSGPVGNPPQGNRGQDTGERSDPPRNPSEVEERGDPAWEDRRHPMEDEDDDSDDRVETKPQEESKPRSKADELRAKMLERRKQS